MNPFVILFAVVGIGVGLYFRFASGRLNAPQKFPCPHCESMDTVETRRDTLGTKTVEFMGAGSPAGGDVRLQLELEVTYHCKTCSKPFKRRITQT